MERLYSSHIAPSVMEKYRERCLISENQLPEEVWQDVLQRGFLDIWVPERLGGKGCSLADGLPILEDLAYADGSLGWTVTLCSGANYFLRNLPHVVAKELYSPSETCFGGSGASSGSATKIGDDYLLHGTWPYATGADRCTHFTLNALIEEGSAATSTSATRSFILRRQNVIVHEDWEAMGMKATNTSTFTIENVLVPAKHSFSYAVFYGEEVLDRIPFMLFADLTLAVNYIGMAHHFTMYKNKEENYRKGLKEAVADCRAMLYEIVETAESRLLTGPIPENIIAKIHRDLSQNIHLLHEAMWQQYRHSGLAAARETSSQNRCFRDYITAMQHAHFRQ